MAASQKPLELLLFHDVLCAGCHIAEVRLGALCRELGESVRYRLRAYPLRIHEAAPTQKEIAQCVAEIERARKEPEGALLCTDLWTRGDPPRSSLPALAALEAARLQGKDALIALASAMKRAALEQGINVARTDVAFELASRVGLNMNRFAAVYQSPETKRLILEEHRLARDRGVRGVPTLVLGGRWMVSGLRELSEYRGHVLDCMGKLGISGVGSPDRLIH